MAFAVPRHALAEVPSTPTRTEWLVISDTTPATDNLASEGWSWQPNATGDGGTLTLDNFYLLATLDPTNHDDGAIYFKGNLQNVTIHFSGDNRIESTNDSGDAYLIQTDAALTFEGDENATLTFAVPETNSSSYLYGMFATSVDVRSGTLQGNMQFVFADAGVSISGGTVSFDASRIPDSTGIYTDKGPVIISGGDVSLSAQFAGVYIPGLSNRDESTLATRITGGNVELTATDGYAIVSKDVYIKTNGNLSLYGSSCPIWLYDYSTVANGKLEIAQLGDTYSFATDPNSQFAGRIWVSNKATDSDITIAPADYSSVEALQTKVQGLDRSLYTDASLQALDDALNAVDTSKTLFEQDDVDAMAEKINQALSMLAYRPGDYSKVDEALAKVPSDLTGYTQESVKALEAAITQVDRGLTVVDQSRIDEMATNIATAVNNLEELPEKDPDEEEGSDHGPDTGADPSDDNEGDISGGNTGSADNQKDSSSTSSAAKKDVLPRTTDSSVAADFIALIGSLFLGIGLFMHLVIHRQRDARS